MSNFLTILKAVFNYFKINFVRKNEDLQFQLEEQMMLCDDEKVRYLAIVQCFFYQILHFYYNIFFQQYGL